ncbi:hypothetical protein HDU98_003476 [Podochytrium sp. JEL0797]|nr:hypothetical protein HDU98_003476 [Podochytrium sp. JEL0797]
MQTEEMNAHTQILIEKILADKDIEPSFLTPTSTSPESVDINAIEVSRKRDSKKRFIVVLCILLTAVFVVSLGLAITSSGSGRDNIIFDAGLAIKAAVTTVAVTSAAAIAAAPIPIPAAIPTTLAAATPVPAVIAAPPAAVAETPSAVAAPPSAVIAAPPTVIAASPAVITAPPAAAVAEPPAAVAAPAAAVAAPPIAAVQQSNAVVLVSGSGAGSYYFDSAGTGCANQPSLADALKVSAIGYTSCEPSVGYQTLLDRGNNYMVALNVDDMNANKAGLCGKQVIIKYNGVVQPGNFVVWDSCPACAGGVRLDFSLGALQQIAPDVCTTGIVPGITWEVTDVQVIPYVA